MSDIKYMQIATEYEMPTLTAPVAPVTLVTNVPPKMGQEIADIEAVTVETSLYGNGKPYRREFEVAVIHD